MEDDPLPAPATKHVGTLHHRLPGRDGVLALRQQASSSSGGGSGSSGGDTASTGTTGTTLWLGGQVLSAYLYSLRSARPGARPRALELGAGIGFLALSLAAAGHDVLATDIEPVLSAVLAPNVAAGLRALPQGSGNVTVRHLDWLDVSAGAPLPLSTDELALDILVTADTVYAAHLVPYLWSTVARVCREAERNAIADSESKSELLSSSRRAPTIYIAIERRDPRMVDSAVAQGRAAGVELKRVAHGRVAKAVERAYGWKEEEWAGVEVWKGRWRGSVEA